MKMSYSVAEHVQDATEKVHTTNSIQITWKALKTSTHAECVTVTVTASPIHSWMQ